MSRSAVLLLSFALGFLGGCSSPADDVESDAEGTLEEPLTQVSSEQRAQAQRQELTGYTFDSLTPTSAKIMRASLWWMNEQDNEQRYPKGRMCASNVSKVLFLSGITRYDQEGVRALLADLGQTGSLVYKLPRTSTELAAKLQTINDGHIPAGTIVAGLNIHTSRPGDQHVGFIGHSDPDGTIWIYHNNWYRPENEGGLRKPHMVSEENLRRGFPRQWMPTPWLRITRDGAGKIASVVSLLPAVDDMDPLNRDFQVTLAVLPDVARELR